MAPKLYLKTQSPPCRGVLLVAKALNLELELEHVDFPDLLTPEMLKVRKNIINVTVNSMPYENFLNSVDNYLFATTIFR